jgi:dTDP-4-dehydrorhamnose reductase
VVTGASGLLGANLVFEWSRQGLEVVALANTHSVSISGVKSLRCDLLDAKQTEETIRLLNPGWIIHCAAATNVEWCERNSDECFRINADASGRLARSARSVEARFVYISTDSVFSGERSAYKESDSTAPLNVYARSKLAGELAVAHELPASLIVRTNIYGWNMQPKESLAEWMLGRLREHATFSGFADVMFCPMLVNDLGDCLREMMASGMEGVFHVVGGEECSKYEFGCRLARVFGLDSSLVQRSSIHDSKLLAPRPPSTSLDISKIVRALGRAMPTVDAGLERFKALGENGFAAKLKMAGERGLQECPR